MEALRSCLSILRRIYKKEEYIAGNLAYNPNVKCNHRDHHHREDHVCGDHGCGGEHHCKN